MNGRVYDPALGRFLSVDPVFQFPTNTQSLNPYTYVLNSPLTLTDPTGLLIEDDSQMCADHPSTCGMGVGITWGSGVGPKGSGSGGNGSGQGGGSPNPTGTTPPTNAGTPVPTPDESKTRASDEPDHINSLGDRTRAAAPNTQTQAAPASTGGTQDPTQAANERLDKANQSAGKLEAAGFTKKRLAARAFYAKYGADAQLTRREIISLLIRVDSDNWGFTSPLVGSVNEEVVNIRGFINDSRNRYGYGEGAGRNSLVGGAHTHFNPRSPYFSSVDAHGVLKGMSYYLLNSNREMYESTVSKFTADMGGQTTTSSIATYLRQHDGMYRGTYLETLP